MGLPTRDPGFTGAVGVRDLWSGRSLGTMTGRVAQMIPPHGLGLYLVQG